MLLRMTTDSETPDEPWNDPDFEGEPFGGYPWTADPASAAEHLAGRRPDGQPAIDPAVIASLAATGVIRQGMDGIPSHELNRLMFKAHEGQGTDGTFGAAIAA